MLSDLTDDEARAALPLKWGAVPDGVIPTWVAEMDYAPAPAVAEAVLEAVRRGVLGYAPLDHRPLAEAFVGFAERRWDWSPPVEATVVSRGVVPALQLVLEQLCPPGPVVVPLPCYPPFRDVIDLAGRTLVGVETDPDDSEARLDLVGIEAALAAGAGAVLLCNPHNPLGTVPTRDELAGLADLARRYGARVVSDEIHAPLTLPGAEFVPYLTVDPGGVCVTSHSKSFNTAGLPTGLILTLDAGERKRLRRLSHVQTGGYSPLGMIAGEAAWSRGDDWLAALIARQDAQRELLAELLAVHLPSARHRRAEATYLAWVDLRAYGVDDPAAAAAEHGVQPAPGHDYQPGLAGHVRLNLATSPERLTEIVRRLAAALT